MVMKHAALFIRLPPPRQKDSAPRSSFLADAGRLVSPLIRQAHRAQHACDHADVQDPAVPGRIQ